MIPFPLIRSGDLKSLEISFLGSGVFNCDTLLVFDKRAFFCKIDPFLKRDFMSIVLL